MKLTYHYEFPDFATLFPHKESVRAKPGVLYLGIIFSFVLIAPGLLILLEDIGILEPGYRPPPLSVAFVLIVVGAAIGTAFVAWFKTATKSMRNKYEAALRAKFKAMHCISRREIELTPEGIRTTCNCGSTLRLWSELIGFGENATFFQLITRLETNLIPKRAFASESSRTEFRALISEKAGNITPLTGTRVRFAYTDADYRNARILHIRKGTSLGFKLQLLATVILLVWLGLYGFKNSLGLPVNMVQSIGIAALIFVMRLMPVIKRPPRKRFHGTLTASFNEQGIQLQDDTGMANLRWQDYKKSIEDDSYWLLYQNDRRYRIFPKRAFQTQQATEFTRLISQRVGVQET
ncbi:MAG TPA: YcxB family protein [Candidatus Angelobacter sp.]|nr:YcxB family protein [Candidatus Angelobacter sp.]